LGGRPGIFWRESPGPHTDFVQNMELRPGKAFPYRGLLQQARSSLFQLNRTLSRWVPTRPPGQEDEGALKSGFTHGRD